ncbi:MAG: serine/threonine protein kinase [Planctomycetes bacterium]|nr:serine/threonine protein kinase [Planctomycetota bacterium]
MNTVRWSLVRRIFEELLELPEDEREAHLQREAGDDEALRREVRALLAADDSPPLLTRLLEPELARLGVDASRAPGLEGARIGRYRLESLVATGGMGSVWRARQDEPARIVAIKTLRAGLHGTQATQRFRFEADVLARLAHPHIARIFEAGTWSEAGGDATTHVPWFAMEYVADAVDLLAYARSRALDVDAKLSLFLQVCDAVRHGHERGVVHRDLKPGNILVGTDGAAKVIDFGVARAVGDDPSTLAPQTVVGQLVGTLQYMSPEQVGGEPDAVGTASDVYALGLLLFELLCGERAHELSGRALPEAAATIRLAPVRDLRAVDPTLSDDLAWIVARAVEKEPGRRYGSVSEFMADIERHRRHEAVLAGPPSASYRVSRFVRRHRVAVGSAASVLLAVLAALVTVSFSLSRERAQRERSERVADVLRDALLTVRPERDGGDAKVVDLLDDLAVRVDRQLAGSGAAEADVRRALGEAYGALGRTLEAEQQLRRVVALWEGLVPPDDVRRIDAEIKLAGTLRGSPRRDEGAALLEEALARLGPRAASDDASRRLRAAALVELSSLREEQGRLDDALALAGQAVDALTADASRDDRARALARLGGAARALDRPEQAQAAYVALVDALVAATPDADATRDAGAGREDGSPSATSRADVASDELAHAATRLLAGLDAALGDDAGDAPDASARAARVELLTHALDVATFLLDRDRVDLAEGLLRRMLPAVRATWGPVQRNTATVEAALARCLSASGPEDPPPAPARLAEAEALVRSSLAALDGALDPEHVTWVTRLDLLGRILWLRGDLAGAERTYAEAAERARVLPDDSTLRALALVHHGSMLSLQERFDEAEPIVREGWRRLRNVLGPGHVETRRAAEDLALVHLRAADGEFDPSAAVRRLREGADFALDALGEAHPRTLQLLSDLSAQLLEVGDPTGARATAERAWRARSATRESGDELSALLLDRLGSCLAATDAADESARAYAAMAAVTAREHGRVPSPALVEAGLGALLDGRPADAAALAPHWDEVATLLRDVVADARRAWEQRPEREQELELEEAVARSNDAVDTLRAVGRADDALVLLGELADALRALYGPGHEHLAVLSANLALCLSDLGRIADARAASEAALAIMRARAGDGSAATLPYLRLVSELAEDDGDLEAAERVQVDVLALAVRVLPSDAGALADDRARLADLRTRLGEGGGDVAAQPRP